jgi:hypothetical protein
LFTIRTQLAQFDPRTVIGAVASTIINQVVSDTVVAIVVLPEQPLPIDQSPPRFPA